MIAPVHKLLELPEELRGSLESKVFLAKHRLAEHPLFTDEGILRILESHPRELTNVSAMGLDTNRYEWGEGDTTGLTPADLLEAVRRGRLWLNVRQVLKHQPELRDIILQLYQDLEDLSPGFRSFRHSGNLIISSPTAFVYFHLDVPANMLWHIRGRKRVWVYPRDNPQVVDPEIMEQTVAGERIEDLPYTPEIDRFATVYDMGPGDFVSWPQNSPHRVQNLEGLNVSISTEHYTADALRRVRVMQANRFLRRRFGLRPGSTRTDGLASRLKQTTLLCAKAAGRVIGREAPTYDYPMTFKVDLTAPDCIRRKA